jgi:hypothetical protein
MQLDRDTDPGGREHPARAVHLLGERKPVRLRGDGPQRVQRRLGDLTGLGQVDPGGTRIGAGQPTGELGLERDRGELEAEQVMGVASDPYSRSRSTARRASSWRARISCSPRPEAAQRGGSRPWRAVPGQ